MFCAKGRHGKGGNVLSCSNSGESTQASRRTACIVNVIHPRPRPSSAHLPRWVAHVYCLWRCFRFRGWNSTACYFISFLRIPRGFPWSSPLLCCRVGCLVFRSLFPPHSLHRPPHLAQPSADPRPTRPFFPRARACKGSLSMSDGLNLRSLWTVCAV